jgi:hypothetical protein
MKTRIVSALLTVLIATGCMSNDTIDDVDVNEDKLFGHYCASYNANNHRLDFWAQLRAGGNTGTTVRLFGGQLSVNGREMNERNGDEAFFNLRGTYYFLKQTVSEFAGSYTVAWDRSDGQRIENEVTIPGPIRVVSPEEGSAHPRGPLTVRFDGPEPNGRETVTAILRSYSITGHGPLREIRKRVTTGREIIFSEHDMMHFWPGTRLVVTLEKEAKTRPEFGHQAESGVIESRYTAERISFVLANRYASGADGHGDHHR